MEIFLFYLLLGAVAGVVGGLFGVGGGVVVVPSLIFAFTSQGISPDVLTHMAVATSLAAMIVTASSSALAHYRHQHVRWDLFKWLACGVVIGTFIGVSGTLRMRGEWIQVAFGVYLVFIASRILWKKPSADGRALPSSGLIALVGVMIGSISMVFGIGGGSMTVPFLLRYHLPSQMAVGTSAALGMPIALFGGVLYSTQQPGGDMLPDYSLGFVYLPALVGLALAGIPSARLGANIAKKLPEPKLKKAFGIFALCMALFLLLKNLG